MPDRPHANPPHRTPATEKHRPMETSSLTTALLFGLVLMPGCSNSSPDSGKRIGDDFVASLTSCSRPKEAADSARTGSPATAPTTRADNAASDEAEMAASTHLKFKDVPLDGPLNLFVSRLERKGFKDAQKRGVITKLMESDSQQGSAVLRGDFAGFKDCTLYVSTLSGKDLVARITVAFAGHDQWDALHNDYANLKSMLTEKYGKPDAVTERFQRDWPGGLDDQMRMIMVGRDACKYSCRFDVPEGSITLRIDHDSYTNGFVTLTYLDRENGNAVRQHAIDDL